MNKALLSVVRLETSGGNFAHKGARKREILQWISR